MTIKYALTRREIVTFFLQGMVKSPKLLMIVVVLSLWPGFVFVVMGGAFSRSLTVGDFKGGAIWTVGAFSFLILWVFLRGKTDERTLSVSDEGIRTQIGSYQGQVPWSKVGAVTDMGQYILILRSTGNAFFIPNRAFNMSEERELFLTSIDRWRGAQ